MTGKPITLSPSLLALAEQRAQALGLTELASNPAPTPLQIVLACSDFIFEQIKRFPELLAQAPFNGNWHAQEQQNIDHHQQLTALLAACASEEREMQLLRQYRNQQMARLAAIDLLGLAPIAQSVRWVSELSEALIMAAYQCAYQAQVSRFGEPRDEQGRSLPMLILAMGKLGGAELNFSSDIDLIFTYPQAGETQGGRRSIEHHQFYLKVAQRLIALLDQPTADGRVFRVDMRLRPFGDSGPLVLSFAAMEDYYQQQGREWERYAMLKARVLGNSAWHDEFYQLIKPFIYRRYIDYSMIEALRSMQRMIEQEVRRKGLVDNIKLGAGGIREIEFVVQALQLIRGGRLPQLQTSSIANAFTALAQTQVLAEATVACLRQHYYQLRQIEHYLQEIADKQTQTLPDDALNRARLCALLPATDWSALQAQLAVVYREVRQQFRLVVGEEDSANEQTELWSELWLSPEPIAGNDLTELSDEPLRDAVALQITQFRAELSKRQIGQRGRDTLDKLLPKLFALWLPDPDLACLTGVLNIIHKVCSRTAYLELLNENQSALAQLVKLCRQSQWVCAQLAAYPMLLDELLDPAQLYRPVPLAEYADVLRRWLLRVEPDDLEQQMETLRQFKQSQQLRIAAANLAGALTVMQVGDHLTALAEAILQQVVQLAYQQQVQRFGFAPGCDAENTGLLVVAYGKTGGYELGFGSDLDLVFLHNADANQFTDGDKSIDARQFYLKLVQRIVHIFITRTHSGILYEVDTRLRPEGASGLMAVHIDTFAEYQRQKAWTWEHQALVRARAIYGSPLLQQQFKGIRQQVLVLPRDVATLRSDILTMREKMRSHLDRSDTEYFDLKQGQAGITDIEFIAQFLVLGYAGQFDNLLIWPDNIRVFEQAADVGLLSTNQAQSLTASYCDYRQCYNERVLQNQPTRVMNPQFAEQRDAVQAIWQRLLLDDATA